MSVRPIKTSKQGHNDDDAGERPEMLVPGANQRPVAANVLAVTVEPQVEYTCVTGYVVKVDGYPICESMFEHEALFIQRCILGMQNYGYDLKEMLKPQLAS